MITLNFYLIFLACVLVVYFINEYSKSNFLLILLFIGSLIGFYLSVFYPVQLVTGWETTIIDSATTQLTPILEELTLLTNIFRITFLASTIVSVMIWTVGTHMDKHRDEMNPNKRVK